MIELTWGSDDAEIRAARDGSRLARMAIAGFDPGDHGAIAIKRPDRSTEVLTIGDERRGTWQDAAHACADARVSLIVCETQFAPTWRPGVHPSVFGAQAGAAMRVARSAGLVLGMISGLARTSHEVTVVFTQPATWQRWVLELPPRYKSAQAKAASVAHANQKIPDIMSAISRVKDREGAADALGLLAWGLTSPLR